MQCKALLLKKTTGNFFYCGTNFLNTGSNEFLLELTCLYLIAKAEGILNFRSSLSANFSRARLGEQNMHLNTLTDECFVYHVLKEEKCDRAETRLTKPGKCLCFKCVFRTKLVKSVMRIWY